MRSKDHLTDFTLASPLPGRALTWLSASMIFACLYVIRALVQEIPPEDHVALSLIQCFILIQTWIYLKQTRLRISLPHNRCWLRHHHLGLFKEVSLPVSQIHSAKIEYNKTEPDTDSLSARIVLITSLGMIPVNQHYSEKVWVLERACHSMNQFLQSQNQYLQA